ncbi:MAG: phosphotransferase family protein [Sterolibacterium sp.]|nr:phosphotransferase family protein [Sterolibacterium sp.]
MPRNIQMLKQVRNVTTAVNQTTIDPEHKALLSVADLYLNELMLQDAPAFYLDFLKRGKALLAEGRSLATRLGKKPAEPVALRNDIDAEKRIEVVNAEIEALYDCMLEVVKAIDESRSAEEKDYLVRMTQWECSLYKHRLEQAASTQAASTREEQAKPITQVVLQAYLEKKFPNWKGLKINKFVTLDGGISKKTIFFETEDEVNGRQELVLRAEQPVNLLHLGGCKVAKEFYMIQLMFRAGMPVPEALWLEEDPSHLGHPFLVSRKAEGKTFGGTLGSSNTPSDELLESIMSTLFQMHDIKIDPADPLVQKSHLMEWTPHKTVRDSTRYGVLEWLPNMIQLAGIKVSPQLMRCLRWLEKNVPDCDEPPVVLHYDYCYNNILVQNNTVSAILDWETSFLGDPAGDIHHTQPNLGVYSMPEFLKVYKVRTGREVTPYRLAYSELMRVAINNIAGPVALQAIDNNDHAPLHMGVMAFKYMPIFGSKVDELIAAAEKAKGR